ncbi:MAG: CaiB/BaiF CoA-transferase family protein [Actinomycetota bacterium]
MSETDHPLSGITVVEMTSIYSGPMAGMMLAELGAEVIKVESPDGPDVIRASGLGNGPDSVNSVFYALNRGKRFCAIDAKTDRGLALLLELIDGADVFLHNMRPSKPAALGLGYDVLAERNQRLIYAAISGVGNDGPEAHLPVYDYVMQAKVGMVDYQRDLATGRSDLVRQVVIDKTSANAVVQGILAALFMRERTGLGQRVDVPMVAAGLAFLWPDGMATAHAKLEPDIPLEDMPPWIATSPGSNLVVLQTTDGEIATGVLLPPWDGLCLALDRVDWVTDERFAESTDRIFHLPQLIEEVAAEVAKYTTEEVLARFAEHDFAAGAVARREHVPNDDTIRHLGLISEQDAPGVGPVRQPAPMWQFSGASTRTTTSLGYTGADSREVLGRLGLTDDEVDELVAAGIVLIADGSLDRG